MLIIDFMEWKMGKWEKVAECPAKEVFDLDREKQAAFWILQDERKRAIMLRIAEGKS